MSVVARTNRLHSAAIQQLTCAKLHSGDSDGLDVAFCLLFEQLLCSFVMEICQLSIPFGQLVTFDRVLAEAEKDPKHWLVGQLKRGMLESGHWLSQWRIERNNIVAMAAKSNLQVGLGLIQTRNLEETVKTNGEIWLSEFAVLLESTRELNNQY